MFAKKWAKKPCFEQSIQANIKNAKPLKPRIIAVWGALLFGACDGTRTCDLLITNELLYQLSYISASSVAVTDKRYYNEPPSVCQHIRKRFTPPLCSGKNRILLPRWRPISRFLLAFITVLMYTVFRRITPDRHYGGVAQLGERLHGMQEVRGSIPLVSTRGKFIRSFCCRRNCGFFFSGGRRWPVRAGSYIKALCLCRELFCEWCDWRESNSRPAA